MAAPITSTQTIPPDRRVPPFEDGNYQTYFDDGSTWDNELFIDVVMARNEILPYARSIFNKLREFS